MEDSYPRKMDVWPHWAFAVAHRLPVDATGPLLDATHEPSEFADKLYLSESLHPTAQPPRISQGAEPFSLQWFLEIEGHRHGRQGRWIPRLLEFTRHSGETLLGVGEGLGTDWLQYARNGAQVIVCSPNAEQLALVRRNFELRGLHGRFLPGQPTCLPLETGCIDVVCVSGVLGDVTDPYAAVEEVYRVLKPGGKVLVVSPAKYNVDYWTRIALPYHRWLRPPTPSTSRCFSRRGLLRLFTQFIEHRVHKRQLRRAEVPYLWRCLPLPLLERLMGHYLILKAFKPLSVALPVPMAA